MPMSFQNKKIVFDIARAVSAIAYEASNYEQILTTMKSYIDYQIKSLDYPIDLDIEMSAAKYPHHLFPQGLSPNGMPVSTVRHHIETNYPALLSEVYYFVRAYFEPNCFLSSQITRTHYNVIIRRE